MLQNFTLSSLTVYQIVAPALGLLMILTAFSKLRRKQQSIREFITWTVIWFGISAAALFPVWTGWVARITGIKSNINAIVFTALIVIFYLLFKIILRQEKLEQDLTLMVRYEALREIKKENLKRLSAGRQTKQDSRSKK